MAVRPLGSGGAAVTAATAAAPPAAPLGAPRWAAAATGAAAPPPEAPAAAPVWGASPAPAALLAAAAWLSLGGRRGPRAGRRRGGPPSAATAVVRAAGRQPSRPRADPDAITSMDMEGVALEPAFGTAGLWNSGGVRKQASEREAGVGAGGVVDFDAVKEAEAKAAKAKATEAMDDELRELLKLTPVERADLVDEISRKAFVLMDSGEIKEATEQLDRVTRIGAAFQRLYEAQNPQKKDVKLGLNLLSKKELEERKKAQKSYFEKEGEDAALTKIRKELHKDDLTGIFAGRFAQFIGGW